MATITSITFDKTQYGPNDTVTMTVNYTSTATKETPDVHNVIGMVGASSDVANLSTSFSVYPGAEGAPDPNPDIYAQDEFGVTPATNPTKFTLASNVMNSFDPNSHESAWTAVFTLNLSTEPSA